MYLESNHVKKSKPHKKYKKKKSKHQDVYVDQDDLDFGNCRQSVSTFQILIVIIYFIKF